jgi:hypothetical protein
VCEFAASGPLHDSRHGVHDVLVAETGNGHNDYAKAELQSAALVRLLACSFRQVRISQLAAFAQREAGHTFIVHNNDGRPQSIIARKMAFCVALLLLLLVQTYPFASCVHHMTTR